MTDRAEIERLLNQTGRTLEGLPEFYPEDQQQKLYREVIEKRELWENRVLHQSDVIELLVGALRDALADRDEAIKEIAHNCNTCKHVTYCTQDCNRIQNGFSGWEWKRRRT